MKNIKNYFINYVPIWDQFVDDSIYLGSVLLFNLVQVIRFKKCSVFLLLLFTNN